MAGLAVPAVKIVVVVQFAQGGGFEAGIIHRRIVEKVGSGVHPGLDGDEGCMRRDVQAGIEALSIRAESQIDFRLRERPARRGLPR